MTAMPNYLANRWPTATMRWLFNVAVIVLSIGCSPHHRLKSEISHQLQLQKDSPHYSGFYLAEVNTGEVLYNINGQKAFTPASVAKVFTLYSALKMLPERLPALHYGVSGDTIYITGTGDPSALHPDLQDSTALRFAKRYATVVLVDRPFSESAWGPGWSWEDFDQYYAVDRSAMPIYGNILRMRNTGDSVVVVPELFKDSIYEVPGKFDRSFTGNRFLRTPETGDTLDVPFIQTPELERNLWSQALQKPVVKGRWPLNLQATPLYGISRDTVCRRMMQVSDNFLAEQLMLLISSQLGDTLGFNSARDAVMQNHLPDLPQKPRWVDGSGLSRYNLFTPESVVFVLQKMYREFPEEQLFSLMAQGGQNGTLRDWHKGTSSPYLFGKSGSMGGVQNVCGYLKTRSGKTLVFAFMNNHITGPSLPVKQHMHNLLGWIHQTL